MSTATRTSPPVAEHGALWDLENLGGARRLRDFVFSQFEGLVRGRVAEIGAGIGTFSERILDRGVERLLVIEPEAVCVERLRRELGSRTEVEVAAETLPDSPALARWESEADFVLCQNVLEHIEDDASAMRSMAAALRPGGDLVVLVPAHPRLFGALDRAYGHHRRYTRERLRDVVVAAGLAVEDLYSFNLLGVPGWLVQARRAKPAISPTALRAYEALLRGWRPIEERWRPPWGLSLIVHARRPR